MFKKTRLRLVALNAVVFFLILNAFGGTLFFYMQHHLFADVDRQLQETAEHMQREQYHELVGSRKRGHDAERRDIVLLWDAEGKLLEQVPAESFDSATAEELQEHLKTGEKLVELNDHHFRTLAVAVDPKQM